MNVQETRVEFWGKEIQDKIFTWWNNNIRKPRSGDGFHQQNKAERAELRRCVSVDEVLWTRGFFRFFKQLEQPKHFPVERLGAVCGILSHVDDVSKDNKLGRIMGVSEDGKKPRLSEARFRRLLEIETLEKLYIPLTRTIKFFDRKAPITDLAKIIYYWEQSDNKTKRTLAFDYYETIPFTT